MEHLNTFFHSFADYKLNHTFLIIIFLIKTFDMCLLFYFDKCIKAETYIIWKIPIHMFWKKTIRDSFVFFIIDIDHLRSPLKDIVVGKNQSEWKKFRVGGKNIFQMFCVLSRNFAFSRKTFAFPRETLRSLAKLLRSLAKIFAFPRKTFAFSSKYFFFFKFCEGTQISLRENAKVLRENAKFLEGTQKFCERTQNIWKIFFPPTLNFFPLTPNFSHHNVP